MTPRYRGRREIPAWLRDTLPRSKCHRSAAEARIRHRRFQWRPFVLQLADALLFFFRQDSFRHGKTVQFTVLTAEAEFRHTELSPAPALLPA